MSRKIARESVYKLIFEYLFSNTSNKKSFNLFSSLDINEQDKEYMYTTYKGVITHYDELIAIIADFTENFSLERIFKADLAALLLASYEMIYTDSVPDSVAISEAVELVKIYSTEKSHQYVNGVLAGIYKKLNPKPDKAAGDKIRKPDAEKAQNADAEKIPDNEGEDNDNN